MVDTLGLGEREGEVTPHDTISGRGIGVSKGCWFIRCTDCDWSCLWRERVGVVDWEMLELEARGWGAEGLRARRCTWKEEAMCALVRDAMRRRRELEMRDSV